MGMHAVVCGVVNSKYNFFNTLLSVFFWRAAQKEPYRAIKICGGGSAPNCIQRKKNPNGCWPSRFITLLYHLYEDGPEYWRLLILEPCFVQGVWCMFFFFMLSAIYLRVARPLSEDLHATVYWIPTFKRNADLRWKCQQDSPLTRNVLFALESMHKWYPDIICIGPKASH